MSGSLSSQRSSSVSWPLSTPLGGHRSSILLRHYDMNKKMSFKEKAQQTLSQGHWRKALEYFQKHCSQEPEDRRSQLKVAELLERLGQEKEAVQVYRKGAEGYAQ